MISLSAYGILSPDALMLCQAPKRTGVVAGVGLMLGGLTAPQAFGQTPLAPHRETASGAPAPERTEEHSVTLSAPTPKLSPSLAELQRSVTQPSTAPAPAEKPSFVLQLTGILALASSSYAIFGMGMQLARTINRGTTAGLSLIDSEMRVWGKLPWIFSAVSQGKVDPWILVNNGLGIALCAAQLALYVAFKPRSAGTTARVAGVMALTGGTVAAAAFLREGIQQFSAFYDILPPLITVLALLSGNLHQHQLNKTLGHTRALSLHRTASFLVSNACWGAYGACKWAIEGPGGAWPLVAVAALGCFMNGRIMRQILSDKTRNSEHASHDITDTK